MLERHEITTLTCRGCARTVVLPGLHNDLVGMHERLRCTVCGHRGADIIRSTTFDPPPGALPTHRSGE